MNDYHSLSHTAWECRYHLVWILKLYLKPRAEDQALGKGCKERQESNQKKITRRSRGISLMQVISLKRRMRLKLLRNYLDIVK